jgi:hypothetical protein
MTQSRSKDIDGPLSATQEYTEHAEPREPTPLSLLGLQATAGNHAVAARLQESRQELAIAEERIVSGAMLLRQPPPNAPPATDQQSKTYSIETDRGKAESCSLADTLACLTEGLTVLENKFNLLMGDHQALLAVVDGNVFAWVADLFAGRIKRPDLTIWAPAGDALAGVHAALNAQDPIEAGNQLKIAQEGYQAARETYLTYKEGNFEGADTTIVVLKGILAADVAVGTAASGGLASGLLGQAVAVGAASGVGAGLENTADQLSVGRPFNWMELAGESVAGFAAGFLSACLSGALEDSLNQASAAKMEEVLSKQDLEEISKIVGHEVGYEAFQSSARRFMIKWVSGQAGKQLIERSIMACVDDWEKGAGVAPPPQEEAVKSVAEMVGEKAGDAFKESVEQTHSL